MFFSKEDRAALLEAVRLTLTDLLIRTKDISTNSENVFERMAAEEQVKKIENILEKIIEISKSYPL